MVRIIPPQTVLCSELPVIYRDKPRETKTRSRVAELTEFEGITKRTAYEKVRP